MANALDAALVDFASTLDTTKAPEKFRCPTCPRLLVNASKGGCCDTPICEVCFSSAANACPQCQHTPYNENTVKPAVANRRSVKAWLKGEKARMEQEVVEPALEITPQPTIDGTQEAIANGDHVKAEVAENNTIEEVAVADVVVQSVENPDDPFDPHSDQVDAGDDDIEIQVEPDHDDPNYTPAQDFETDDQEQQADGHGEVQALQEDPRIGQDARKQSFDNNDMNFPGMDFNNNPMMQQMQQMMNGGFNPMMNMQMGMPMGNMFGGFGPNGGMNGMNMMNNFNPQNMFQAFQNNSTWQNNNANAFPNAMGGDFNYGFNSNFNPGQQFPNGDFHQSGYRGRGYGRGRGRGRGGYGRGRGNFHNNFDTHSNFQPFDQQFQGQQQFMNGPQRRQDGPRHQPPKVEEQHVDDDEFAPGGQEEVQEALGDDYAKKEVKADTPEMPTEEEPAVRNDFEPQEDQDQQPPPETAVDTEQDIPEAYAEDLDMAMAPPSGPSAPSRHVEKDFGFRSRGPGKFQRNRGSLNLSNGHPPSPVRPASAQSVPQNEPGPGVVGAPTGPRAMREPPKPARESGGFQIMGRASLASRISSRRSPSPNNDYAEDRSSRRHSYRDDDDRNDRRASHRRSTYDENGDYDMQDQHSGPRPDSRDRSRKSRRDRDKYDSRSSKHDSRRLDDDHDLNDYGESIGEDRGDRRDRKYRDQKRERDHDRDREKGRDRERERDRDRDRAERDREREDRHRDKDRDRKRRRDRDDEDQDDDQELSRHKSRRHRREHASANAREEDTNGRASHRTSQAPTPTVTTPVKEDNIDPHTRERMERDRQRMLKEQQRRDNAAVAFKGSTPRSGGGSRRQMSFKYEDEAERGMIEGERERNRARWR